MLTSQDTGSDFAASALADWADTPKAALNDASKGQPAQSSYFSRSDQKQAPLPPLPDLPVRGSHNSSNQGPSKPITFTSNPSLSSTSNTSDAKAWVAHSDGRTENINAAPELKSALPAKVERNLNEQAAQVTANKSPLAKDLAQAAKAGQPVAWVAHKDGRLNDIDSEPKLAEAMPAKVSNKLTSSRSKRNSGFFGKVKACVVVPLLFGTPGMDAASWDCVFQAALLGQTCQEICSISLCQVFCTTPQMLVSARSC